MALKDESDASSGLHQDVFTGSVQFLLKNLNGPFFDRPQGSQKGEKRAFAAA